ncbi:MAG: GIY-YIG nuclease family protein [Bacteroidetes bacterium]|nr:MAG: GIY-YIG nuclease family protein [Bacteroidota bacterium]
MFFVYVLYSIKFDRTYTGMTTEVERRIKEHNNKQNRSTKAYTPWILIHKEGFISRVEARKREKYLKSGNGREYLKLVISKKAPWRN